MNVAAETFTGPSGEVIPSYLSSHGLNYSTKLVNTPTDGEAFVHFSAFPLIYFREKIICIPNIQLASSVMHHYSNQHNTEHFRP